MRRIMVYVLSILIFIFSCSKEEMEVGDTNKEGDNTESNNPDLVEVGINLGLERYSVDEEAWGGGTIGTNDVWAISVKEKGQNPCKYFGLFKGSTNATGLKMKLDRTKTYEVEAALIKNGDCLRKAWGLHEGSSTYRYYYCDPFNAPMDNSWGPRERMVRLNDILRYGSKNNVDYGYHYNGGMPRCERYHYYNCNYVPGANTNLSIALKCISFKIDFEVDNLFEYQEMSVICKDPADSDTPYELKDFRSSNGNKISFSHIYDGLNARDAYTDKGRNLKYIYCVRDKKTKNVIYSEKKYNSTSSYRPGKYYNCYINLPVDANRHFRCKSVGQDYAYAYEEGGFSYMDMNDKRIGRIELYTEWAQHHDLKVEFPNGKGCLYGVRFGPVRWENGLCFRDIIFDGYGGPGYLYRPESVEMKIYVEGKSEISRTFWVYAVGGDDYDKREY